MARRQIYEYPGEILWQSRDREWYLDNDPEGINKAIINLCVELSKLYDGIGKPEELLDNSYRVAVAIASTKNRDFYPVRNFIYSSLPNTYFGVTALICGCEILSRQENHADYEKIITEIDNSFKEDLFIKLKEKIKFFLNRTIKKELKTELVPNIGLLSKDVKEWIIKNVKDKRELEIIISFLRTRKMQMSFLDKFVHYHYVMVHDAQFTLTEVQFQTLKDNVEKGQYLKKSENELPLLPNSADASQFVAWRKECENRIRVLGEENEMLQKRCERMDVMEQVKVLYDGEQRVAQELIDRLKAKLDAKDKEIKELKSNVETYEQMAKKAMEDKDRLDKEIGELRNKKFVSKPSEESDCTCNKADDWKKINADWIIEYGEHKPKNLEHAEGIQNMLSVFFADGSDGKAADKLSMVNRILKMGSNYEANHAPKPIPPIGMVNQLNMGDGLQDIKGIENKTAEL